MVAGSSGINQSGSWISAQHQSRFPARRHPARLRFRQEQRHRDIAQVDDGDDLAASGEHFVRLGQSLLDPANAWCRQVTVNQFGLQSLQRGDRRFDA